MRISRYSISFICRLTDGLWILVENGERSGQKRSRSAMKLQRRSVKRRSRRPRLPSTPSTRSTLAKRSGISARTSACHKPLVFSCRLLTTRLRSSCTFFFHSVLAGNMKKSSSHKCQSRCPRARRGNGSATSLTSKTPKARPSLERVPARQTLRASEKSCCVSRGRESLRLELLVIKLSPYSTYVV